MDLQDFSAAQRNGFCFSKLQTAPLQCLLQYFFGRGIKVQSQRRIMVQTHGIVPFDDVQIILSVQNGDRKRTPQLFRHRTQAGKVEGIFSLQKLNGNIAVRFDFCRRQGQGATKNIIVVDDMIASGSSMIEVATYLKHHGAKKVYLAATFALLTEGPKIFIDAYKEGLFDKLYATNLSYVPKQIRQLDWYEEVDMTEKLARIINTMHDGKSLKPLFNGKEEILQKLAKNKK